MNRSITAGGTRLPAVKHPAQGLALLCLLALLVLFGAGVSHGYAASAPTGIQLATTNGTLHLGGATSPTGVRIAPTNGDIHVGE
jgi:hypothetical protein